MWIAPHLTGGLGNRLFQLAASLGLSEKWGRQTVFFLPKCGPTNHGPFETIFLMFPDIPIVETAAEWVVLEEPKRDFFNYLPFDDKPSHTLPTITHGFRQSPKYFPTLGLQACLGEVLDARRWLDLQAKYQVLSLQQKESTWFLHVRLGDYKILPHHQVNLQEYYIYCLRQVPQGSRILFFSDEVDLCKEMFQHVVQALGHSFQAVEETDELESLALMSQCWGGSITANSTFSWWGAYFAHTRASSPEKHIAFYPENWGAGQPPPTDLIPFWGKKIAVEHPL